MGDPADGDGTLPSEGSPATVRTVVAIRPPQTVAACPVAPATPATPATSAAPVVEATAAAPSEEDTPRCDICDTPLDLSSEDEDSFCGKGLYMWTRGDKVRFEEVPLCASCGMAIGLTALQRWQLEDEEG
jgi:hypothetical protein